MEEKVIEFLRKHRGAVLGAVVGLVMCILWFTVGFWRTLLALVIIAVFALLGSVLSKSGWRGIMRFLDKIFK